MADTLILGTAQLGNSYGINNKEGELDTGQAFGVLHEAYKDGIRILDTAEGYGKSEKVIGDFIRGNPDESFEICTKLSSLEEADGERAINELIAEKVRSFVDLTGGKTPWIYYLHDFGMCQNKVVLESLLAQRKAGNVQRIGVSIYEAHELEFVLRLNEGEKVIDAIQIPYNVFNCSQWLSTNLFKRAAELDVLLLARSVFLQGLVFKNLDDPLVARLHLKEPLAAFDALAKEIGCSRAQLACDFVRACDSIGYILLGCETIAQVEDDARLFAAPSVWDKAMIGRQFEISSKISPEQIDPRKW